MYVQGRDVFVGQPKSSGEWLCSNILPTSLENLPYLLEKHGWKRVDGHTALACSRKIAYRKLVLAVALVTSFCVTTFLAARKVVQVFPDVFPHIIRLVHETRSFGGSHNWLSHEMCFQSHPWLVSSLFIPSLYAPDFSFACLAFFFNVLCTVLPWRL